MSKRHFLQQAHKHNSNKHLRVGSWLSEKLDGQRAFWDGGFSRGLPASEVPFANTAKDKKVRIATGLWSRYGKPIHAPAWFLDNLPIGQTLDGELWIARGAFQATRSAVAKHVPVNHEWLPVKFVAFDSPRIEDIFFDSIIDLPNYYKVFEGCIQWFYDRGYVGHHSCLNYREVFHWIQDNIIEGDNLRIIAQYPIKKENEIQHHISRILLLGGEGVVTRDPDGGYVPERVHNVTKMKPYVDDEGEVIGYVTGSQTDKGSKLRGLMGAMIVSWKGKTFELSGFTDAERVLMMLNHNTPLVQQSEAFNWAWDNPKTECPLHIRARMFPRGSKVTFKYRELTDDGIPKEASYLRKWTAI